MYSSIMLMVGKSLTARLSSLQEKKAALDAEIREIEQQKSHQLRKEKHERARIIGMAMLRLVEEGSWSDKQLIELITPLIINGKERRFLGLVPPLDKPAASGKEKASSKPAADTSTAKGSEVGSRKSASKSKVSTPLPEPATEDALMSEFNL